ncbi:ATPase [Bacillus endophyticus]|uniref:phospholipase D-like domain-containing protein n=1 Tax=Priestia endophytica TaxID=135735 RepID=UPI0018CD5CDA|nr:phospholipase D-like domain-containing protein [Priestia endophytica]MBG9812049.1 ATPase [Priestia endophytica]
MKKIIPNVQGEVILSYEENGYQSVIDKFKYADFIKIVTYNINTYEPYTNLIKELRKIDKAIPITLILNIPERRENYINKRTGKVDKIAVKRAADKIKYTLNVLEREKFGNLNVFFNFDNHAKLIMTDKTAYIGSQNFSDASHTNIELGIIINGKKSIKNIEEEIFLEIQNKSIRYTTSHYNVLMEQMTKLMRESLHNIREDIFTWVGDEPYTQSTEILDISNAYFNKEKWENFSNLHLEFEDIVEKLIDDYPSRFNKKEANKYLEYLEEAIESFASELNELATFKIRESESIMWEKFHDFDVGANMEEALEDAMSYVNNLQEDKFWKIEHKGKELIKTFEKIEDYIENIETVIEEIKDEMINHSVYENIELIKNYK